MPGWRQRLQTRSPRREEPAQLTTIWGWNTQVTQWFSGWAWGLRYANDIVRAAKAIERPSDPFVRRIAQVEHERNAESVLERMVPLDRFPHVVTVPDSLMNVVIPPHVSFHWLRRLDSAKFARHIGFKPTGMADWWADLKARPDGAELWRQNKYLRGRQPSQLDRYVPLQLFDDAGPVANAHSSFVRCYWGLLGKRKRS